MHILRRWGAWHPEWWLLIISIIAWYLLLAPHLWSGSANMAGSCAACRQSGATLQGFTGWSVMVLAMMLPLMIVPARATAFGSLWRRRHWAIAAFIIGYITVWMIAGIPSMPLLAWLRNEQTTEGHWVAGSGFLIAAAWQSTRLKRRLLTACHQNMPLAPDGWAAHRDCLHFGAIQGLNCLGNCGIIMLTAMLSQWHQAMMIVVTVILLYERYQMRPRNRVLELVLVLLAVGHFIFT
jgi:hypothetical protein